MTVHTVHNFPLFSLFNNNFTSQGIYIYHKLFIIRQIKKKSTIVKTAFKHIDNKKICTFSSVFGAFAVGETPHNFFWFSGINVYTIRLRKKQPSGGKSFQ